MSKKSTKDSVSKTFDLAVIGSSAGGIDALTEILSNFNKDFLLPIVIVQHRAELSAGLVEVLQTSCAIPVMEPEDKSPIEPGYVYVAPSGYHLLIEMGSFALSVDSHVNWSRPSIDVLFESAAEHFGPRIIGIVLTGRNNDGAHGLARLKELGALTVVQEPSTAPNRDMPESAIASSLVDHILDLKEIANLLIKVDRAKRQIGASTEISTNKRGWARNG